MPCFSRRSLASLSLSCLLLVACAPAEDNRPGQPVKSRQQAFKQLIRTFEPMGKMLKDNRYDADKFLQMANQLVVDRETPWSHFGPDTQYPPSKSLPAVWERADEFAQARQKFIASTDQLLEAARSKDKAVITTRYQQAYDTCRDCHHTFRER